MKRITWLILNFIGNFRIMFDSSVLGDSIEQANIDDVLIAINQ